MRKGQVGITVFLIIGGIWCFAMIGGIIYARGFKDGQINYANGIIKYELKQQANGEKVWQEKK